MQDKPIVTSPPHTAKLTFAGLDFGNGWLNLSMRGKVAKIPAAYSLAKPRGEIRATGNEVKPKAFSLTIDNTQYWFGQDVLGSPSLVRELDEFKYNPAHIRILWLGILAKWSQQHKIDLSTLGEIQVVTGMPADLHNNQALRTKAAKAYRQGLRSAKTGRNDTRQSINGIKFSSKFLEVAPEAASYGQVRSFKPSYMIVLDMGYGTDDLCLFAQGNPQPLKRKTENNGLVSLYANQNLNQNEAELTYARKQGDQAALLAHVNATKNRLAILHRALPEACKSDIGLTLIGGGAVMANGVFKSDLQRVFNPVIVKDEYENARIFEDVAKGMVNVSNH